MQKHPYSDLSPEYFWSTGAARIPLDSIDMVFKPKNTYSSNDNYVTYGSCFAQRFSAALIDYGFNWIDAEPASQFHTSESKRAFNYGVFSSRTGNIYSTAMLLQWIRFAQDPDTADTEFWLNNGRYYDPLRLTIEPNGFGSESEAINARSKTLIAFKASIMKATVFVFTMGLTEYWQNKHSGFVYSMCPGTVAGQYDETSVEFVNANYVDNFTTMERCIKLLRGLNPNLKILLTVSPVPNTATAEANAHILSTNSYCKSTLRAVAGDLVSKYDFIDYFPSYELITAPPIKSRFYNENLRTISPEGVAFVMSHFFRHVSDGKVAAKIPETNQSIVQADETDESCDDILLEAFNVKQ